MFTKSLCLISALTLFGACSHKTIKKTSHPYHKMSKSFLDVIKTKKPGQPEADKRTPASKTSIPGLGDFILALEAYPAFMKVPVGFEVIKESKGINEGDAWNENTSSKFLVENAYGYFVLESDSEKEESFILYDKDDVDDIKNDILSQGMVTEFRKVSDKNWIMVFNMGTKEIPSLCHFSLDLSKSSELVDISCKDPSGKLDYESKVTAVTPINVQDYGKQLQAIKLEVYPKALDCDMVSPEKEEACSSSVVDDAARDWSYLLK